MMNMKRFIIFLCVAIAAFFVPQACSRITPNPEFKEGEVYIYDNKPSAMSATLGEPAQFTMMVSPNDGSVSCRWLLDGVIISDSKDFEYTFNTAGTFTLRFEAERDGHINYRVFTLTVA